MVVRLFSWLEPIQSAFIDHLLGQRREKEGKSVSALPIAAENSKTKRSAGLPCGERMSVWIKYSFCR